MRITDEQAERLKHMPDDTPTGRRNNLLMCLLLDHGLRIGEAVAIQAEQSSLADGLMRFRHPKVSLEQTHRLTNDTLAALRRVIESGDLPSPGPLLRKIENNGRAGKRGLSEQGANAVVRELGRQVGFDNLSPHDARHYWATLAAENSNPFDLQEAGGWASLDVPRRYIERQEIANAGICLDPARRKKHNHTYDLVMDSIQVRINQRNKDE